MKTVYCDWSSRKSVAAVWEDDPTPVEYARLDDVLNDNPSRIVIESTFNSFDPAAKAAFLEKCERRGITVLTIPTRLTERHRISGGFGAKSDSADSLAIRRAAKSGVHMKKPDTTPANKELVAKREEAEKVLVDMRRDIDGPLSKKSRLAIGIISLLPEYRSQPVARRLALGNGKVYGPTIVAAVAIAARFASTRREFDFIAGLYAHAYPSIIRADLFHHGWAGGGARRKLNGARTGADRKGCRGRDDITLTDFRRELRWLYHQIRPMFQREAA